jgi:hypothetical protein
MISVYCTIPLQQFQTVKSLKRVNKLSDHRESDRRGGCQGFLGRGSFHELPRRFFSASFCCVWALLGKPNQQAVCGTRQAAPSAIPFNHCSLELPATRVQAVRCSHISFSLPHTSSFNAPRPLQQCVVNTGARWWCWGLQTTKFDPPTVLSFSCLCYCHP